MKKKITITCIGEQKIYHDYYKPFLCKPDVDLPKMYNAGWSSFRFDGGEPEFKGVNMPDILRMETANYKFFECQILVINSDGKETSGYYYKSVNKATNEINETFDFS